MNSSTLPTFPPLFFFSTHSLNPKPQRTTTITSLRNAANAFTSCPPCNQTIIQSPCADPPASSSSSSLVAEKVKILTLEFKALSEPIERVKRLLHYAANLPPCGEVARLPESRVPGCTTQVWVEAEMDEMGKMRFRADSDSEISKGFCSCLIWMLDGAEPTEVLEIRGKDLEDVNVGLYGKANSRVNTWHNVLLAMQRKTRDLVSAAERSPRPSAFSVCE